MLARSKKSLRPLAPLDNVAVPVFQYNNNSNNNNNNNDNNDNHNINKNDNKNDNENNNQNHSIVYNDI